MPRPNWRLIVDGDHGADYNMALDEALALCADSAPTLRLYGWDRPSVSLGRFQHIEEVDIAYCEARDIPIVRRPTGGRGILHVSAELTYGFAAPSVEGEFSGGLFKSYALLGEAFKRAFTALGVPCQSEHRKRASGPRTGVCFQSTSFAELAVGGRKIIGSAQRRYRAAMLQQGSIPITMDYEGIGRVFGSEGRAAMAGLGEFIPGLTVEALREAVVDSFQRTFAVRFELQGPSPRECELRDSLCLSRYADARWTTGRDSNTQAPSP